MKRLVLAITFCLWSGLALAQGYIPSQASNITAGSQATTGAFSAAISAKVGYFNYLCGFVITSGGTTTAAVVQVTVTGTVAGTLDFTYVFPSSGQGVLGIAMPQCIGASAPNTAITVSVPAGGAGTTAALSLWGFQTQD